MLQHALARREAARHRHALVMAAARAREPTHVEEGRILARGQRADQMAAEGGIDMTSLKALPWIYEGGAHRT